MATEVAVDFCETSWLRCGAALALCGSLACSATTDGPPGPGTGSLPSSEWLNGYDPNEVLASSQCEDPQPGESPLRRLTNLEYQNTLLDLGFDEVVVKASVASLPNEPESLGFRNGASALSVTSLLAQKYSAVAQRLSAKYAYPCELDDDSACADQMIHHAGGRVHRRPLTNQEKLGYRAIYDQAIERSSHDDALGWVIRAMLQSPHFLYRVEIPHPDEIAAVTGYEMANRLSYMLWQAPPDEELRAAVAKDELKTPEQVLAQAHRMLEDPRAENSIEFFEQWLDLDELHEVERDPDLYPDISPQLATLFKAEARSFLLDLLRQPGSSYADLLTANHTFANAELAEHYGLDPVVGDAFVRVETQDRSGVLTQGMLSVLDGPTRTSIVRRGLKIRTDFLCQIVSSPPDTVDLTLNGIGADLTQAERLAQHREDATCADCHSLMDPIGEIFEGFDAVGRRRTVDEFENPVVEEGALADTLDADGPISGVTGLGQVLSESEEAQQCYLIQNMRYFLGREVTSGDLCSQAQLTRYWRDRELGLAELLIGITQTDAFLYKARKQGAPADGGSTDMMSSGGQP